MRLTSTIRIKVAEKLNMEEQLWVRANTVEVCESVGDNNTIRHLSTKRQTYTMFGGTRLAIFIMMKSGKSLPNMVVEK